MMGRPKPSPDHAPAAEGQRQAQAGIVDAVDQADHAVGGTQHGALAPAGVQHQGIEGAGMVVVVAHQQRGVARPYRLRAAGQVGRRAVQAEEARLQVAATGLIHAALPQRQQLGHVLAQRHARFQEGGPVLDALAQIPLPIGRPQATEQRLPVLAVAVVDGAEAQVHRHLIAA